MKFVKNTPLHVVCSTTLLEYGNVVTLGLSCFSGILLKDIPAKQNMMSEMHTKLKHLLDTAIKMTSSRTITCKIWTKNTVRKSTSENS